MAMNSRPDRQVREPGGHNVTGGPPGVGILPPGFSPQAPAAPAATPQIPTSFPQVTGGNLMQQASSPFGLGGGSNFPMPSGTTPSYGGLDSQLLQMLEGMRVNYIRQYAGGLPGGFWRF